MFVKKNNNKNNLYIAEMKIREVGRSYGMEIDNYDKEEIPKITQYQFPFVDPIA